MLEFDFSKVPTGIDVSGKFDASCRLRLSAQTMDAIERGTLRLKIVRMGAATPITGAQLDVSSSAGNIVISIGANSPMVVLGENTSGAFDLRLWRNSSIRINTDTTSNGLRIVCDMSDVSIGSDCMFSEGILVQAADQHGIVDLKSGQITNNRPRKTVIENHVWLGRNSTVLPDVLIGEGSVVGAGAIVTKDIPKTCIAAGVPARVIRTGATWSRSTTALDGMASQYIADFCQQTASHGCAP